jgi:hypothetical protein
VESGIDLTLVNKYEKEINAIYVDHTIFYSYDYHSTFCYYS